MKSKKGLPMHELLKRGQPVKVVTQFGKTPGGILVPGYCLPQKLIIGTDILGSPKFKTRL